MTQPNNPALNEDWKPQIGDWFILKASYCGENEGCTKESPCKECLKMSNRFVITADHCGVDFFFGGGWCNRDGGHQLNDTYSGVLSMDESKKGGPNQVHHVSEAIFIGRYNPEAAALQRETGGEADLIPWNHPLQIGAEEVVKRYNDYAQGHLPSDCNRELSRLIAYFAQQQLSQLRAALDDGKGQSAVSILYQELASLTQQLADAKGRLEEKEKAREGMAYMLSDLRKERDELKARSDYNFAEWEKAQDALTELKARLEDAERDKKTSREYFEDGYICAVANMLKQHGETTIAKDCLDGVGPESIDWSRINEFDVEELTSAGLLPHRPTQPGEVR